MGRHQGQIMSMVKNGKPINDIIQESLTNNEKKRAKSPKDMWFHGKLTRGNAIHNLKKKGLEQGKFLVRESVSVRGSFVLSLVHNASIQHFQITSSHSGCFCIDKGPQFVGLDELIAFYRKGANGLPTMLNSPCIPGNLLPPFLCQYGENTIVHQAVEEQVDTVTFRKILTHSSCPNLNTRNKNGMTAMHEACQKGLNDFVLELSKQGADVSTRDSNGNSALHIACRSKKPETCKILIKHCQARPQDRCSSSGWVALHEAANLGHHSCLEVLLQLGAASYARGLNDETPLDLARKNNHQKCVRILERFIPAKPSRSASEWLHESLDRNKAIELLEHAGLQDGCFLVRVSKRHPGQHVLTMSFDKTVFNYEIKNKLAAKGKHFYIDDGPYFTTLDYLIDYYTRFSDGLPNKLSTPISSAASSLTRKVLLPPPSELNGYKSKGERPPIRLPNQTNKPPLMQKPQLPPLVNFPHPTPRPPSPSTPPCSQNVNPFTAASHSIQIEEIDPASVKLGRELGQGEFGSVLMGVWTNKKGEKIPVALKTLHGDHINDGESEFKREAEVMMSLNHQCIVKLYGICRGESLMMVQELVSMGSALDYILDYPTSVSLNDFKLWGAMIASGMNYLESKCFVHRDLALRNILLASKKLVKISDFGLSRAMGTGSDYYKASAGGRWPVKWYAPESINYGTFSSSSDVWSYGVTLWEIFSWGEQPYDDMTGAQVIQYIEDSKRRLAKPKNCPDKVYAIMLQCWAYEPKERPTFRRLHTKFRQDPDYFCIQIPGHS